jgi:putative membrane protein
MGRKGFVSNILAAAYPWVKSLHIIAVIAWMAGLLYLPRLFVYHADSRRGSSRAAMLEVMERRLLHGIMLPAAAMAYGFGFVLAATPGVVDWRRGWILAKQGLVVLLTVFNILLAHWRRDLAQGRNPHPPRFYRIINELPTIAMIAIVLLVVAKPF